MLEGVWISGDDQVIHVKQAAAAQHGMEGVTETSTWHGSLRMSIIRRCCMKVESEVFDEPGMIHPRLVFRFTASVRGVGHQRLITNK